MKMEIEKTLKENPPKNLKFIKKLSSNKLNNTV